MRTAAEHLRVLFNDQGNKGRLDAKMILKIREGPAREFISRVARSPRKHKYCAIRKWDAPFLGLEGYGAGIDV